VLSLVVQPIASNSAFKTANHSGLGTFSGFVNSWTIAKVDVKTPMLHTSKATIMTETRGSFWNPRKAALMPVTNHN
jgi:hypothetical protein